jgi:uncharacterized protein
MRKQLGVALFSGCLCFSGLTVAAQDKAVGLRNINTVMKQAEAGNIDSQMELAVDYSQGSGGVPADPHRADYWYERVATNNQDFSKWRKMWLPRAEDILGDDYFTGGEPIKSFYWFSKGAEHGYQHSQVMLGSAYIQGRGTKTDVPAGCKWLLIAERGPNEKQQTRAKQKYQDSCTDLPADQLAQAQKLASVWKPTAP